MQCYQVSRTQGVKLLWMERRLVYFMIWLSNVPQYHESDPSPRKISGFPLAYLHLRLITPNPAMPAGNIHLDMQLEITV